MLVLPFRLDGAGGCDRLIPLICRPVPSMTSSQCTAIDDPGLPVAVVSVIVASSQYTAIDDPGLPVAVVSVIVASSQYAAIDDPGLPVAVVVTGVGSSQFVAFGQAD